MTERQLQHVLNWINRQRVKFQKREPLTAIPLGVRRKGNSCPIASALNSEFDTYVGHYYASFGDLKGRVHQLTMPTTVRLFIHEFDSGNLPQYDKEINA